MKLLGMQIFRGGRLVTPVPNSEQVAEQGPDYGKEQPGREATCQAWKIMFSPTFIFTRNRNCTAARGITVMAHLVHN